MPIPKITYQVPLSLYNGTFELGDRGWKKDVGWSIATNPSFRQPGGTGVWAGLYTTSSDGTIRAIAPIQRLLASPGQLVTMSVWVFVNSAVTNGTVYARLTWIDKTGAHIPVNGADIQVGTGVGSPALPAGWYLATVTSVAPANTYSVYADIVIQGATTGTWLINDVIITGLTSQVTLAFLYPPTKKPAYSATAQRTDTFSTAGVRQTVILRDDQTIPITMATILDDGADLQGWQAFVDFAHKGGSFIYYPDATNLAVAIPCFMQEADGSLDYSSPGCFSFKGTFQREVAG